MEVFTNLAKSKNYSNESWVEINDASLNKKEEAPKKKLNTRGVL